MVHPFSDYSTAKVSGSPKDVPLNLTKLTSYFDIKKSSNSLKMKEKRNNKRSSRRRRRNKPTKKEMIDPTVYITL